MGVPMTRYDELLSAITTDPEDDTARFAFAEHIQTWEPDRAEFIRHQLQQAHERRQKRGRVNQNLHPLLERHEVEWTRTIAKYATRWMFDRGFVTLIHIDPYIFLEYGEWLLVNAPIRVVEFSQPMGEPFPMIELANSPLLAKLDMIGFHDEMLTQHDIEHFAKSQHLDRLLVLGSVNLKLNEEIYSTLAENAQIRKALVVALSRDGFPGQRYEDTGQDDMQGRSVYAWTDLRPEGKALEARYGYIPWLHRDESLAEPFDAAWYVANGILPVKPPGSPVG
jgi:uncharacterized protein (TIGR02996 family)